MGEMQEIINSLKKGSVYKVYFADGINLPKLIGEIATEKDDDAIFAVSFQDIINSCEGLFSKKFSEYQKVKEQITSEEFFKKAADELRLSGYPEKGKVLLEMVKYTI